MTQLVPVMMLQLHHTVTDKLKNWGRLAWNCWLGISAAGICERSAVKGDSDIWVQQLLSESLAVVKQGKCHRSAAVSLCVARWDLPCPHTHPSWVQETSCVLCDPPLALCSVSDVRDHDCEQDSQTLSCAVRKLIGIGVCVYQEGG